MHDGSREEKKEQCEPTQTLRWEEMNVYHVTVILHCINRKMLISKVWHREWTQHFLPIFTESWKGAEDV